MQFGGFAISPVVGCMAKDFVAQLKADGRPIVEGAFLIASYDPVRMIVRSNQLCAQYLLCCYQCVYVLLSRSASCTATTRSGSSRVTVTQKTSEALSLPANFPRTSPQPLLLLPTTAWSLSLYAVFC